jgi:hypothetical protein
MTDSEDLFPPRPGGWVDTARRERAGQARAVPDEGPLEQADAYDPVRTIGVRPDVLGASTVSVAAGLNPVIRVLGADANRHRAVLLTLDEPVVVAVSMAQAGDPRNASNAAGQSAGGLVLPVNVPLVIEGTAEVWAAATSSTPTRVSAWTETYSG